LGQWREEGREGEEGKEGRREGRQEGIWVTESGITE
jgi:hypothetical protein